MIQNGKGEDNAGWFGGRCRCPDGKYYLVGDNFTKCKELACVNGKKSGKCHRKVGPWSQRKVICGKQ